MPETRTTVHLESESLLSFRDIERVYPGETPVHALNATTLSIDKGEIIGLVGRSGSGKSTLLNILGLLDKPTGGSYRVQGVDTGNLSEAERTALRSWCFGFVFQNYHLLGDRTAQENVELALTYRHLPIRERRSRAAEALDRVDMSHRRHSYPGTLSGGESQRVAIARALVQSPTVLLCDEPTGNLDQQRSDLIVELLRGLGQNGPAVVIATHDQEIAAALPRCLTVSDGNVSDSFR